MPGVNLLICNIILIKFNEIYLFVIIENIIKRQIDNISYLIPAYPKPLGSKKKL